MAYDIVVSDRALTQLNATRPWVKFLAILGFIFTALMILVGLMFILVGTSIPGEAGMPGSFGRIFGIVYLILAFLYLFPCLYLIRYARAIEAIPGTGQAAFEEALKNQKSFWKFVGILTIVMLGLYVLFIFVGVFAAMAGLAAHH
ncbi:MAG TPA: hypothetical protein VLV87_02585 [Gammaproteobacteria bacterium]|nr:hypothetical protein [Gammaproteobacteria bacterium]